tara:strand:+ start:58 stop:888 length:831 start_codon:yes stop_codon:yes gene_type:complete
MKRISFILILFIFQSCDFLLDKPKKCIVTVYDQELLESDINIKYFDSEKDSINYVKYLVDNWIKEKIMVYHAKKNIPKDMPSINRQVEEYKNQLIIFQYQNELIKQKLDTFIRFSEVEDYYSKNKKNFKLKEDIFKMLYIKVRRDAPNISKLKKWYVSNEEKDKLFLEEYCYQFAQEFDLNDSTWVYFSDIVDDLPVKTLNYNDYKNGKILEDSTSLFFIIFKDHKTKHSITPLQLEFERIKDLILNERKFKFLNKIELELYEKALIDGKIKYEKN